MLKNIIANWSVTLVSVLGVFLLYPFLISTLGDDQYGTWLLVSSFVGYFGLLQIGVPLTTVKYLTESLELKDHSRYNLICSTSFIFFLLIALIILLTVFIFATFFHLLYDVPHLYERAAKIALILAGSEVAARFLFQVYESAIHANQKFTTLALVKNAATVFRIIVSFVFISRDNGLYAVALVLFSTALLQGLMLRVLAMRHNKHMRISLSMAQYPLFKSMISYSVLVLLLQIAGRLSFNSDALILGAVVSVSSIVIFSIANSLLLYLMEFMVGISAALMPHLTQISARGEGSSILLGENYRIYSRYAAYIMVAIGVTLTCFVEPFFRLWIGVEYSEPAASVFNILIFGYVFYLVQRGVAFPLFMATGNLKWPVVILLVFSILNILLSIWWGKNYGVQGVAWGTTVPNIAATLCLMMYTIYRFKVNVLGYIKDVIFFPVLSVLIFIAPYTLVEDAVNIESYSELILSAGLFMAFYAFAWLLIFSSKNEKKYLISMLKRS